ncbi:MAG: cobalt transporter CbiM [Gammaproteobacteria bacterium]|nr:cobalt transporter CbiM [Gammaproteobacteria bacterium]
MHISEGILPLSVWASGYAVAVTVAAVSMRNMDMEEIPKISVLTAVFFIASLIKVPLGPASIHLILNGLLGVILGRRAFIAIMLGIILQAIIFGHGGITVIGINTLMMGTGALVGYGVWRLRHLVNFKKKEMIFGALAGAIGSVTSGSMLAAFLMTTGQAFNTIAEGVLLAHIPIMIIEAVVTGACADFLHRIRPDMLTGHRKSGYQ